MSSVRFSPAQYFATIMVIVGLSVIATVIVLQFHHHDPSGDKMPKWVGRISSLQYSLILFPASVISHQHHLSQFTGFEHNDGNCISSFSRLCFVLVYKLFSVRRMLVTCQDASKVLYERYLIVSLIANWPNKFFEYTISILLKVLLSLLQKSHFFLSPPKKSG